MQCAVVEERRLVKIAMIKVRENHYLDIRGRTLYTKVRRFSGRFNVEGFLFCIERGATL
jgi:hypothetical protein